MQKSIEMKLGVQSKLIKIEAKQLEDGRRRYTHSSEQIQRDNHQSIRRYEDFQAGPWLQSQNLLIDAIFAMSLEEFDLAAVEQIEDAAFNWGQPTPCHCFETGELWRYVWTRDLAYSVALGLPWFDPKRSLQSLRFKLSKPRLGQQQVFFGEGLEIVQDTGTGGSWPVSTDRVSWAFAAETILPFLSAHDRSEFMVESFEALVNTLETDRLVVFDSTDGLYRGEQSFLDWREQSYASWTATELVAIGTSKALSTNALHFQALEFAARLASDLGDMKRAERYQAWADELKQAIQLGFWDETAGMFRSMTSPGPQSFSLGKYDLLGQALAVIFKIATQDQAQLIFSRYPISQAGSPVIHPQQPDTAIYHNRGIWPFVSGLAMLAAKQAEHAPFVTANFNSLIAASALNLSNMENLEWLTGLPHFEQGSLSGPVVNSRRQLWSVAAMVSIVKDQIFGLKAEGSDLQIKPGLTQAIAKEWFPEAQLRLEKLSLQDRSFSISLSWDASGIVADPDADGFFELVQIIHNGNVLDDNRIAIETLADGDEIRIELAAIRNPAQLPVYRILATDPDSHDALEGQALFAPRDPGLQINAQADGSLRFSIERRESTQATRWSLYENGQLIAKNLTGTDWTWKPERQGGRWLCYEAVQEFISSGNQSHPSREICIPGWTKVWTAEDGQLQSLDGASQLFEHGRFHFNNWGHPDQTLLTPAFIPEQSGRYLVDIEYSNAFGQINTGITAAVKELRIIEQETGLETREFVFMPHRVGWANWGRSSPAAVSLQSNRSYRIELSDFKNMSYLTHFSLYTGGPGGQSGAVNRANISAIQLKFLGN